MSATALQQQLTAAIVDQIDAQFNAALVTTATITRQDTAGAWQTVGTATPVYLSQEEPSALARALGVAEVLRTRWALSAYTTTPVTPTAGGATTLLATLRVGDRLTWGSALVFLVAGLDLTDLPGAVVGTLERVLTS